MPRATLTPFLRAALQRDPLLLCFLAQDSALLRWSRGRVSEFDPQDTGGILVRTVMQLWVQGL